MANFASQNWQEHLALANLYNSSYRLKESVASFEKSLFFHSLHHHYRFHYSHAQIHLRNKGRALKHYENNERKKK